MNPRAVEYIVYDIECGDIVGHFCSSYENLDEKFKHLRAEKHYYHRYNLNWLVSSTTRRANAMLREAGV